MLPLKCIVADPPTTVGNCCSAICVVFLLFSLVPYFQSLVIAHILRGTSNSEGISARISF
jgi:hypothetical protein